MKYPIEAPTAEVSWLISCPNLSREELLNLFPIKNAEGNRGISELDGMGGGSATPEAENNENPAFLAA